MCASNLRRHQVHVVVKCNCEQEVGFAHTCFALNVYVYAVALNEVYTFKVGSATESACLFVY